MQRRRRTNPGELEEPQFGITSCEDEEDQLLWLAEIKQQVKEEYTDPASHLADALEVTTKYNHFIKSSYGTQAETGVRQLNELLKI